MLELQHPAWLLLLLLVPLLWWRPRARGGRAAMRFSSFSRLDGGRSLRSLLADLPLWLQLAGLVFLIVALARPQLTHREQVIETEGIDIILAIDTSGSMDELDFEVRGRKATRLDVAKAVVSDFIAGREHDRVGLVVFGEEALTQAPLTQDHLALQRFLDQVQLGIAGRNATAVGEAVAVSSASLAELEAPSKVVILLTDGRSNAGKLQPIQAAEAAAALGIRVYTIGVGSHGGANTGPFGFLRRSRGSEVDERTLKKIAKLTDAQYFRATDTESLVEVYALIDEMETTTAEVREFVHREERYRLALLPGLALFVLGQLLSETLLRRLP